MPLFVKDYVWEETETNVFITVPLKGVKAGKIDVLTSEEYLKVSFPPYIFECLLAAKVDDIASTTQVGNGAVLLRLNKQEPGLWGHLQSPDHENKEAMKIKREKALELARKRAEEMFKQRDETKRENERLAIQEMMKLEEGERNRIETWKQEERDKATADLEAWKDEQRKLAEQEKERLLKEKMEQERAKEKEEKIHKRVRCGNIFTEAANEKGVLEKRKGGKIEVSFTERVFPTPVRESTKAVEDEWLQKQAEARQVADLQESDLTEEEKNPQFLLEKANAFFAAGNYQAAINVYTHALRLSPKMPSLYSNRAACHLKLHNLFKCIEDCSKALDLLSPPVPQNATSRLKCLVRRGTAFCQLEMYVEGLLDYEHALKIDPNNKQLQADAERMRQIIQGSTEM